MSRIFSIKSRKFLADFQERFWQLSINLDSYTQEQNRELMAKQNSKSQASHPVEKFLQACFLAC